MSTILVVDDQLVNRQFLTTLLGYFDHKIIEARDGNEALKTLRSGGIDLIIADVLMPTMDGYDLLQQLRTGAKTRWTPVIFYSAAPFEPEARAMAEARGVRYFLTKPAEPEQIIAAVNGELGLPLPISPKELGRFNRLLWTAPADPIDPDAVVFIVDQDASDRESAARIISRAGVTTKTFPTAEAFLEDYQPSQTNCLLMDVDLPGISGIGLLEDLRSRRLDIPAVILTANSHSSMVVAVMRFGVDDFLEKPADSQMLLAKIFRVLQKDSIRRREDAQMDEVRRRLSQLTTRERNLLKLLILGKSSKEIASALQISIKTVSNHRSHLMAKTRAENLADLVRMSMIAHEM